MHNANTPPGSRAAPGHPPDTELTTEAIARSEPVLIELQSLLSRDGSESIEAQLMPTLILHRLRLHILKQDLDRLEQLAGDAQVPGFRRALQVREQVQHWLRDGLLVTVRHAPLTDATRPTALARFFGLFGSDRRGCLITPSRETVRQMLAPGVWPAQRPAPLIATVERGAFRAVVDRPAPPAPPPPTPRAPSPAGTPPRKSGPTGPSAEQRRWLDQLIEAGCVFVPDTSALMHSPRQTARRFFERELLPRLQAPASTAPNPSRVWVHRRVRGELMRHTRSDDPSLVAKAADGLKALTMLADAGLVVEHDDAQGPLGVVDSYADPALELLLRSQQHRQRLCIVTQDRGLAAKLLAQRDAQSPTPAVIARLCVDGSAAIEPWDGLLAEAERAQAAREVSVDARVQAQLASQSAAAGGPQSHAASRRSPAPRSDSTARPLADGAQTVGTLRRWKDEQGFGFVEPDGGGPDLFLHIRALPPGSPPPRVGARLTCIVGRDGQGRLRAEKAWSDAAAAPAQASRGGQSTRTSTEDRRRSVGPRLPVSLLLLALIGLIVWLARRWL